MIQSETADVITPVVGFCLVSNLGFYKCAYLHLLRSKKQV